MREKKRVLSVQSGNGQLLAQLFLLLQTKKGSDPLLRVSASGCLPVLSMGYTPQGALWWRWASTHRETSSRQRAASICADSTAHERNSAQEVEQAEKNRTRVEILQHRNKCCINTTYYRNAVTSSPTIRF